MNKVLKIAKDDIVLDYRNASDLLMKACSRKTPLRVAGLCESEENLIISLEESEPSGREEYVFSKFQSENEDDLIGEIRSRYFAGFSTVGDFYAGKGKWGLFSRRMKSRG